ncbi:kinase-like domain-containing protein [Tuber brumale]|nr:kinase-like domain-containing protein [Tuber brumale]
MQYTTRQAHHYTESALEFHQDWLSIQPLGDSANSSNAPFIMRPDSAEALLSQMESKDYENEFVPIGELRDILKRAAALVCRSDKDQGVLIRGLVGIPFAVFSKKSINLGISLWTGVIHEEPRLQSRILTEIARNWEITVEKKMGLFSDSFTSHDPFELKMEYAPPDKEQCLIEQQNASDMLSPHLKLLHMLSSHYHATRNENPHIQKIFLRLVRISLAGLHHATSHPLSREVRFKLVLFGLQVLKYSTGLTECQQWRLKDQILSAALTWFKFPPQWSFGGDKLQIKAEAYLLQDVANLLQSIATISRTTKNIREKNDLLLMLVENELTRLATWLYPLGHLRKHHLLPSYPARPTTDNSIAAVLPTAWHEDPAIAVQLIKRFQSPRLEQDIKRFIMAYPEAVVGQPDALQVMLGDKISSKLSFQLKYLLYWAPVNPITATTYLLPSYANNSFILQYAMRALQSHSIDVTLSYVPQIVQTLRYDTLGYVERFILEMAKFSQLFAHQIIWNMKANSYKDEDSQIPDPIKPTLDKVMNHLIGSFSDTDKSFYEREFSFFNEVTSISGKLRPYIKKSKLEKNQKIAEELAKINVDVGVYLPSNPDGVVIDIDRKSGKSLQSHAKAPFMATFRISKKDITNVAKTEDMSRNERRQSSVSTVARELWQAAIFKVGDDCRQDMLALQLISTFRNIFNSVGLDVWVFPYRVTATGPGCGVIDVLPNSISRDMLGRDHKMGLYDYFINRYGSEGSIKFQEARNNFVESMAAYSVISYLLKFKDRHNGNIMINDTGHIIHIDFGFCFDIAPGGITFERAPFKLTTEMISVMGGSKESQSYLRFEELCIKSFLACRTYVDKLAHCVVLMLDSGLPCFKPETIQNFKDRFVLDKNEREAAGYMRHLVKKSYGSYSTVQYDRFQHLTNGITY